MSGCYTPAPNSTLNTRPKLKCMDTMREVKRESTEIAAPRLRKEPSMALYSRPPNLWNLCSFGLVYSIDWVRQRLDIFSTGGMGPKATMFLKRVATLLAAKTGQNKSLVMANLRRRLRFELLKSVLVAVRGHHGH